MAGYISRTSDEAVKKATGKIWSQWFALLDKAGAKKMPHIEIARMIQQKYLSPKTKKGKALNVASSSGWWAQMVTVEYERSCGLRMVNQNTSGFLVSVHRTFPVSAPRVFTAWRRVAKKNGLEERTLNKKSGTLRYKRREGKPQVVVMIAPRGRQKTRIAVAAVRLPSRAQVEKNRRYWKRELLTVEKMLT